ncbi:MAG TPA: hypothetical protein VIM56_15510 [Rhizomicrobium sp.]
MDFLIQLRKTKEKEVFPFPFGRNCGEARHRHRALAQNAPGDILLDLERLGAGGIERALRARDFRFQFPLFLALRETKHVRVSLFLFRTLTGGHGFCAAAEKILGTKSGDSRIAAQTKGAVADGSALAFRLRETHVAVAPF